MGTWGAGLFENDDAADWMSELLEGADIDEALTPPVGTYIDIDAGARALVAAEVVAAINGHPSSDFSAEARSYVAEQKMKPSKRRTRQALHVLDDVRSDGSELKGLWDDSCEKGWFANVRDLRKRLEKKPVALPASTGVAKKRRAKTEIRTILELPSPKGAYSFSISEIDSPAGANTQGALSFRDGGSGLFMVMGVGLGITAKWRDDKTLVISIAKKLDVDGPLGELEKRIQNGRQVVNVVYQRT